MERSSREALERGVPVTAVVLLIRDAVLLPGSTQRWVAGMRGQMRPSDLAGMLAEGEIGLLMHDTTAQHARNIASRLRAVVDGLPGSEPILIGVATRVPGLAVVNGIVREARADALRSRATDPRNAVIAREGRR
jgi:PleD family two-component response regulator